MEDTHKFKDSPVDGLRTTNPKALPYRIALSSQKVKKWLFTWGCRRSRRSPCRSIEIYIPTLSSSNIFAIWLDCHTTRERFSHIWANLLILTNFRREAALEAIFLMTPASITLPQSRSAWCYLVEQTRLVQRPQVTQKPSNGLILRIFISS